MSNVLDKRSYLFARLNIKYFKFLIKIKRMIKIKRIKNLKYLIMSSLIYVLSISPAHSVSYSTDHLKLYAHSRILIYKEFQCFNRIITKESRWNYTAKNGSHYGLGQMRSKYYRDLDPYRQIDVTLRYITKRYNSPCLAWAFHVKNGFY